MRRAMAWLVMGMMLTGCMRKVTAFATCGRLQSFESAAGRFNSPKLSLGTVFKVSKQSKRAFSEGLLTLGGDDVSKDDLDGKETHSLAEEVDVTFDVETLPSAVKVQAEANVKASTNLVMERGQLQEIGDWRPVLERDQTRLARLYADLQKEPDVWLFLIFRARYAEEMSLGAVQTAGGGVGVEFQIANFQFQTRYACDELATYTGSDPISVFFRAIPFRIDVTDGVYRVRSDLSWNGRLSDLDFSQAFVGQTEAP